MPVSKRTREANWGKTKKHYHKKIAAGLCTTWMCTSKAEDGLRWCSECRERENKRSKAKRTKCSSIGKCESCPNEAMQLPRGAKLQTLGGRFVEGRRVGSQCEKCYLKAMASYLLGSRTKWDVLTGLLDACNWTCSYTGDKLILGDNLSFDHMDPVCRFPEKKYDPGNLEPVTWQVNVMKRDMTKSEFLALIGKIHSCVNRG